MLRKILLLASGNTASSLLLFARNILVARMISPEDYGIASTFAMVMAVIEMLSQIGMQQLIVQDDAGDDPHLQASLQGFHLLRIVVTAAMIVVLARPIAVFMGIPDVAWAFQLLAIPRLAQGFLHYDIYRLQRHLAFLPMMTVYVLAPLAGLLVIYPLALWVGDYRIMLYSLIVQEVLRPVLSHLTAERPYRLALDMDVLLRATRFGWPLLLNSALMFLTFNGEKIVVGRELGMDQLALFAMAVTLTMNPALVLARVIESLFLPRLSALKHEPAAFAGVAYVSVQAMIAAGLVTIAVTVAVFAPLTPLVLSQKYLPMIPLLYWLALLQALRDAKGVALVSLALARNVNVILVNLCRIAALPFAWWAAVSGLGPVVIVWIAIGGETLGLVLGIWLIRASVGIPIRPLLPCFSALVLFYALFALHAWSAITASTPIVSPLLTGGLALVAFALSLGSLTRLWRTMVVQLLPTAKAA